MKINHRRMAVTAALGAAFAAVVPFVGAGTAVAAPTPQLQLEIGNPVGGLTVHIINDGSGWPPGQGPLSCTYSSMELGGANGYYQSPPFVMLAGATSDVVIWPAIPTGNTWTTTISCPSTGWNYTGPQVQF
jgi:hypothetical protein